MNYNVKIEVHSRGRKGARIEARVYSIGEFQYTFTEYVNPPNWFEEKILKRTFDDKLKRVMANLQYGIDDFLLDKEEQAMRNQKIRERANEILNRTKEG